MFRTMMMVGVLVAGLFEVGAVAALPTTQPAGMEERTGLVTARGQPLTLVGHALKVGDAAPTFTAVANDMSTYRFEPASGAVWIISSVPSLDTAVCSAETHHFNEEAATLGKDVHILTISMDLPFAQKRWCGAMGVQRVQTVSDYRDRAFGRRYGVYVKQTGLLSRAVFVVNRSGQITYIQIVPELSHEPDYAAVLAAARKAEEPQ
jgi:thiol peroxidase